MKNLGKIITFFIILLFFSFILIFFREQIISIDESLFQIINGFSNPFLDIIFIPLTHFGSIFFWVIIVLICWSRKEKKLAIYLIYSIIINSFLSFSLKWLFRRSRPSETLLKAVVVERSVGPSFPSGHAEMAFSGATILSYFYKIFEFETVFYILAIITAISRIYLGVHYPIDTLFGALIGIIIGNLILNLPTKKIQERIEDVVYRIKTYFQRL